MGCWMSEGESQVSLFSVSNREAVATIYIFIIIHIGPIKYLIALSGLCIMAMAYSVFQIYTNAL